MKSVNWRMIVMYAQGHFRRREITVVIYKEIHAHGDSVAHWSPRLWSKELFDTLKRFQFL